MIVSPVWMSALLIALVFCILLYLCSVLLTVYIIVRLIVVLMCFLWLFVDFCLNFLLFCFVVRDIKCGEEICYDYALTECDPNWLLAEKCLCGQSACRGKVTGNDWKLPQLQQNYGNDITHILHNYCNMDMLAYVLSIYLRNARLSSVISCTVQYWNMFVSLLLCWF